MANLQSSNMGTRSSLFLETNNKACDSIPESSRDQNLGDGNGLGIRTDEVAGSG